MAQNTGISSSIRVLLVEDNDGDALLTQEALKRQTVPVEMQHVRNGLEALKYLNREGQYSEVAKPDLILLDLNMPLMDGREFLTIIKNDSQHLHIPVVVLTTSEADSDILKSYELHASCFITKSVDFIQFKASIAQITEFWFNLVKLPGRCI